MLMGRVYKFYPAKPLFLASVGVFEIGSAIAGSAPNSIAFIIGRAVSGLGSSGIMSGGMLIMFHTIPLRQRPMWQGMFGMVFALGSVIGPLLGGAFTDSVTWRWCFYINLPVGAISILVTMFVIRLPNQKLDPRGKTLWDKVSQLDPIGNLIFFPGVICLILALQWGGTMYNWGNWRIILLLVFTGVLIIAFVGVQIWKQDGGVIPPRLMKMRSIWSATIFAFFNQAGLMVLMYYLPIYFQAIKGRSPVKSGIMLFPLVLSTVFSVIVSGALVSKLGYYNPFMILSSIIAPIGAGLLTTLTPTTGHSKWIGYQFIYGFGQGLGMQQSMNVVQTVLERSDIATGTSLIMFVRFLGSAVFLPVAQNIFVGRLASNLQNLPGINPAQIIDAGATGFRSLVSDADLPAVLVGYSNAITRSFFVVVGTSCIGLFASFFVEWKSLKVRAAEQAGGATSKAKAIDEESVDEVAEERLSKDAIKEKEVGV
jgi:MFS family permease